MRFFSLISLLVVVGLIVWMSTKSIDQSETVDGTSERNILTPIDEAEHAKYLIESRNQAVE